VHLRAFFTYLLVAILLACPAMCRATEVACCPGHETEACSDEPGPESPAAPGDADADSCICSGTALKSDDSHAKHVLPLLSALLPESFELGIRPILGPLALGSLPTDPDDWLGPVRLHALLEVFRC
jgi:hypothetical protein